MAESESDITQSIETLSDPHPDVRHRAVRALGSIGPAAHAAVPHLRDRLEDDSAEVCRAAADALGMIGLRATSTLPRLIEIMRERSDRGELIRSGIGGILGGLLPPPLDEIEPVAISLGEALEGEFEHARYGAAYGLCLMAYGLSLMGERADWIIRSLVSDLGDDSGDVRYWASAALLEIGPPAVRAYLPDVAASIRGLDENMDEKLLMALEDIGGDAGPAVESLRSRYESLPDYVREFVDRFQES